MIACIIKSMKRTIHNRLKEISRRIKGKYNADKVILYGSHARGEATRDSDIDLLIVAPAKERFFLRMAKVLELVRDLYSGLALSPIVLRPNEVALRLKKGDHFIKQILKEGIEL